MGIRINRSLFDAVDATIARRLRARGGALPGNVVSYDPDTETCYVQPGVHRRIPVAADDELDELEEMPILVNVPVAWPRGRGFACVGELAQGDPVLLVVMDRDITAWRRTGAPAEPEDAREGSWSSVVAIPGLQADVERFPVPSDKVALASLLDKLIRVLASASVGVGAATDVPAAILAAFPGVVGSDVPGDPYEGLSTGTARIKVDPYEPAV